MSNVTPESTKKLYCFWSDHTSFSTILYDFAHHPTPKQTANKAETAWPGRPTRSMLVVAGLWKLYRHGRPLRPLPQRPKTGKQHGLAGPTDLKNFTAFGLIILVFLRFSTISHTIQPPNRRPTKRKQHGPAGPREACWLWQACGSCIDMEDLCDLYHNAPKQGNSMAWPAQRTHF